MGASQDIDATGRGPLLAAAADAREFLARGYERARVLELVGDRHGLNAASRQVLRRGVFAPALALARRQKLLGPAQLVDADLAVDGHNVLITLRTALTGGRLLLADDGVVRDIAQIGRNHRPDPAVLLAAQAMTRALAAAQVGRALILFYGRLPRSGWLAAQVAAMLAQAGLNGQARAVGSPLRPLAAHPGPVASADSVLLDLAAHPVDLAGQIIQNMNPQPPLESLRP